MYCELQLVGSVAGQVDGADVIHRTELVHDVFAPTFNVTYSYDLVEPGAAVVVKLFLCDSEGANPVLHGGTVIPRHRAGGVCGTKEMTCRWTSTEG